MSILAWRICDARYAATMWEGVGARDHGGRWNSRGVSVVYASESRALAAMEQLVHLIPPQILGSYLIASIALRERQITRIDRAALPPDWRDPVAPASLRRFGDDWAKAGTTLALAVPSAVVDGETNFLINPLHADFRAAVISPPARYAFDPRLK